MRQPCCLTAGGRYQICEICEAEERLEYFAALGHSWPIDRTVVPNEEIWNQYRPATFTQSGIYYRVCERDYCCYYQIRYIGQLTREEIRIVITGEIRYLRVRSYDRHDATETYRPTAPTPSGGVLEWRCISFAPWEPFPANRGLNIEFYVDEFGVKTAIITRANGADFIFTYGWRFSIQYDYVDGRPRQSFTTWIPAQELPEEVPLSIQTGIR